MSRVIRNGGQPFVPLPMSGYAYMHLTAILCTQNKHRLHTFLDREIGAADPTARVHAIAAYLVCLNKREWQTDIVFFTETVCAWFPAAVADARLMDVAVRLRHWTVVKALWDTGRCPIHETTIRAVLKWKGNRMPMLRLLDCLSYDAALGDLLLPLLVTRYLEAQTVKKRNAAADYLTAVCGVMRQGPASDLVRLLVALGDAHARLVQWLVNNEYVSAVELPALLLVAVEHHAILLVRFFLGEMGLPWTPALTGAAIVAHATLVLFEVERRADPALTLIVPGPFSPYVC